MPPSVIDAIAPLIALFGVGTMILIGMKLRYSHVRHTRVERAGREEIAQLAEDVAALRDEIQVLRQDVTEMYERLEFTERVLAQGRPQDRLPPPDAQR
jgi:cell division protein FtsB